jgi:hypothetical protein
VPSGLLRRVALVRTDVSEEPGASFIRATKIGELGTTQSANSNRRTLRRKTSNLTLFHITLCCDFIIAGQDYTNVPAFVEICYTFVLGLIRSL